MTAFDNAPEPDDRPGRVGTALVPYRPRPTRSRMARAFRWWLGVSAFVLLGCVVVIGAGLYNLDLAPVHIVINGDDVTNGVSVTGLGDDAQALLGMGGLMLGLLVLLLIPMLLLLVVATVAISLVIGVGVPLIAVAFVLVVVTSPFWMIALVVWLVARRRRSPPLPSSARMAA